MEEPQDLEKGLEALSVNELLGRLGATSKLVIEGPGRLCRILVTSSNGGYVCVIERDFVIMNFPIAPDSQVSCDGNFVFNSDLEIIAPYGCQICVQIRKSPTAPLMWLAR